MAGLTGALLFYCLSLTPSLLPRVWYLQAVMSGVTVAIGYWYPLVTFWQVAGGLAFSTAAPPGHGHTYGMAQAAGAWASIIPPPGWTAQQTAELGALAAN